MGECFDFNILAEFALNPKRVSDWLYL